MGRARRHDRAAARVSTRPPRAATVLGLALVLAWGTTGCAPTRAERVAKLCGKTGVARVQSEVAGERPYDRWIQDITVVSVDAKTTPPRVTLRLAAEWLSPEEEPFDLTIDIDRLLEFEFDGRIIYARD